MLSANYRKTKSNIPIISGLRFIGFEFPSIELLYMKVAKQNQIIENWG